MDDICFYVTDPLVSLPYLMAELTDYGQVSNFQINYMKSEILQITISPTLAIALSGAMSFTWQPP